MKKILYLMHIDWNWIKQRPQYIEEKLEEHYEVFIICPRNYRLHKYHDKNNMKVFYSIPYIRRIPYLCKLNDYLEKLLIRKYVKKIDPDCIYATSPKFESLISSNYEGIYIYDCMDNALAFSSNNYFIDNVYQQELKTVQRADVILVSSKKLMEVLMSRYSDIGNKLILVRNGYDGNIVKPLLKRQTKVYTLCYFGTISHWFNFEYIMRSLDDFSNIRYLLIGPIESGTTVPTHQRIIYSKPVDHNNLEDATASADGFVMPFKLNELIQSVDPVKLYEYINFGKDILSIYYPEIKRFEDFVYFYTDYQSYKDQIEIMLNSNKRKYNEQNRMDFLKNNSWDQRTSIITDAISTISNGR